MGAFRGLLDIFLVALLAGRMARLRLSPLVFGFFAAGFRAEALVFLLRLRSRISSSSGSPSLLCSDSSSDSDSFASIPLSLSFPRFLFVVVVGLAPGANLLGFRDTRPDLRRAAGDATWSAPEGEAVALMIFARVYTVSRRGVEVEEGGATIAIDVVEAGTAMGDALYVRALLVQGFGARA